MGFILTLTELTSSNWDTITSAKVSPQLGGPSADHEDLLKHLPFHAIADCP